MLGASPIPPSTTHRHNTVQAFCTISHELFDSSNKFGSHALHIHPVVQTTRPSISYDHRVSTPPASCPAQPTPSILFLCVECVLPNCRRSENTVTDDLLILVTAACTTPAPIHQPAAPGQHRRLTHFFISIPCLALHLEADFTISKD